MSLSTSKEWFSYFDMCRVMLCTTPVGARVCISLLDRMVELFDAPDPSDGAKVFDTGYASSMLEMCCPLYRRFYDQIQFVHSSI
jgi:hypothetical protein